MTTAPKGKPYIIGGVKAQTSKAALGKARKKFPGSNVSVKLYYRDTATMNAYNVYAARQPGPRGFRYDRKTERYVKR